MRTRCRNESHAIWSPLSGRFQTVEEFTPWKKIPKRSVPVGVWEGWIGCAVVDGEFVADVLVADGAVVVHARATGVTPETVPALEADLRAAAARHGARLEVTPGGAADLETVLLDLMDSDHPAATAGAHPDPTTAPTTEDPR